MTSVGRLAALVAGLGALMLVRPAGHWLGPGGGAPARDLVVLSPHWEGIRNEFGQAFERHMAGRGQRVRVRWLNPGGTSACVRFARSRFAAMPGGIGVDLFFGGGVEPFLALGQDGLLAPVELAPATLAALPERVGGVPVYDPAIGWYGTCLTTFGIVYNKEVLRRLGLPEPRSFDDLGRPELNAWVGVADPRRSGTIHMIYELILQARGWEEGYRLLARAAAGSRRFYQQASEVPLDVGAGELACGMTLDSYAWAQVAELGTEAIGFVVPEGESVVNADAIAALRGSPEPELGRAFIEFVLSPAGQALWFLPRGSPGGPHHYSLARLPIRPDVYRDLRERAQVSFDPFAERAAVRYDPALGSARWNLLNGLVGAVLIDLHRDMARAWTEVVAAGSPAEAVELITRPPIPAAEADRPGAARTWADPLARDALLARWADEARARLAEARRIARAARAGR